METYFIMNSNRIKLWEGLIIGRIAVKHFDEVKPFLSLYYCALREKLVHIFNKPNTMQYSFQEIYKVTQNRNKTISAYINRLRLHAGNAYSNLRLKQREPIVVAALTRGLAD